MQEVAFKGAIDAFNRFTVLLEQAYATTPKPPDHPALVGARLALGLPAKNDNAVCLKYRVVPFAGKPRSYR